MEIIQCPNCSANNIEVLSKGVYKCNDCGSVFTTNDASPQHNVPEKYVSGKSKIAAALFGIFLGSLGIYKIRSMTTQSHGPKSSDFFGA